MSQMPVRFIFGVRPGGSPPEVLASVASFSGVVTWPSDLLEGNILAIDTLVYKDIEEVFSFVAVVSSHWRFHFGVRVGCYSRMPIVWYHRFGVRFLCLWRRRRFHNGLLFLVLLGYLHWILHPLRGSILSKVFACWIYLVGSAPVWQQCFKRVFQFKSTFTWKEMRLQGGFHRAILHY